MLNQNIFIDEWFYTYSLTNNDIKLISIFTAILASIIVITGKLLGLQQQKIAWLISLINSSIMVIISLIYFLVKKYRKGFTMIWTYDDFAGIDNVSVITCIIFGINNICDIVLGIIFYPKYLDYITTYFHHFLYIWLMYFAITGNGLFTTNIPFTQGFVWCLLEEVPTALLAIGTIIPSYRTDIGFGITFFIFRIVYHLYLTIWAFKSNAYGFAVLVVYLATLSKHIFWFINWIINYDKKISLE